MPGANKLISDKQKGKATYFILETNRMLKRKTKTLVLSLPKKANRILPTTTLPQVLAIYANLKERFFITSIDTIRIVLIYFLKHDVYYTKRWG